MLASHRRTARYPDVGADIAQLVEQRFCKPQVPGSSPVVGSSNGQVEQVVSSADCRSAVFDCGGSIPFLPTTTHGSAKEKNRSDRVIELAHVAQLAEHVLGKDEVTGSSPVVGSTTWWKARTVGAE